MTYLSFMDFTGLGEMVKEQYQQIGIFLDVKEYERSLSGRRVAANEHHLTINVPWGAGNVFGHPTALWPNRANAYQGPLWGEWIASGGESGREPPAEVKRVNDLYQMAKMAPPDEAAEMAKEMWRIILDQQWDDRHRRPVADHPGGAHRVQQPGQHSRPADEQRQHLQPQHLPSRAVVLQELTDRRG